MRAVKMYTSFAKSSRRDVARRASRRERRLRRRDRVVAARAPTCCVRWAGVPLVLSGPRGREEMVVMKGVYFSRISVKSEDWAVVERSLGGGWLV